MDKGVKGEFRVRDLEVVAGDDRLETIHQEYGIRLLVDPSRVYFNPRLAGERHRVASLVREGRDGHRHVLRHRTVRHHDRQAGQAVRGVRHGHQPGLHRVHEKEHRDQQGLDRGPVSRAMLEAHDLRHPLRRPHHDEPAAHRQAVLCGSADPAERRQATIHFYHICERHEIDSVLEQMVLEARGMGVCVDVAHKEELKTYSPAPAFSAWTYFFATGANVIPFCPW